MPNTSGAVIKLVRLSFYKGRRIFGPRAGERDILEIFNVRHTR